MTETDHRRGRFFAWVLGGVGIEIVGALLIWRSLPDFGGPAIAGLVCVVLGSLVVTWGIMRRARLNRSSAAPSPALGNWTPEAELQTTTPRAVHLSRAGRRMIAWWALMLLALPVYAYFVWQRTGVGPADYRYEYIEGEAVIHDKQIRETASGRKFYLYYNFESTQMKNRLRASAVVTAKQYDKYRIGDTLKVLYLAPNPTVHEIPELEQKPMAPRVIWLVVGVAGLLLVVFEAIRRRHRSITVFGVAAPGKIKMLRNRGAGSIYTVEFNAGGEERSLRGTERTQQLREGDTVTVLYTPNKPDQALIYRLSMYEARRPGG